MGTTQKSVFRLAWSWL